MSAFEINQRVVTTGGRAGRVIAKTPGTMIGYLVALDSEEQAERFAAYELEPEPRFAIGDKVRDRHSGEAGTVIGARMDVRRLIIDFGGGVAVSRRAGDLEAAP